MTILKKMQSGQTTLVLLPLASMRSISPLLGHPPNLFFSGIIHIAGHNPCPFGIFTGSSWYRDPGFTGRLFISKIGIFKNYWYYQSNPLVFMRWSFFIMTTAKFGPFFWMRSRRACRIPSFWVEGVYNSIWVSKWEANFNMFNFVTRT